jgi:hypothetical protein
MSKFLLIQNPNPSFARIEIDTEPGVKKASFAIEQLTRPISIFRRSSEDQLDDKIVLALKLIAGRTEGFNNFNSAKAIVESFSNIESELTKFNINLGDIL